jgi:hypothetical protein
VAAAAVAETAFPNERQRVTGVVLDERNVVGPGLAAIVGDAERAATKNGIA